MRTVAGAEIAPKLALHFASGGAQRNAAEVGANAKGNEPVFLARLGALRQRLRITERADRNLVRLGNFGRCQVTNENRLLAPAGLDRLTRLNRRNVDFDRRQRAHIGARVHLVDERQCNCSGTYARPANCSNMNEIPATNAFFTQRFHLACFCHAFRLFDRSHV